MSTESAAVRTEVERHIREHVEGERARVERVSRIREFVLGAQDGLLVPLGVVTWMAAANPGRTAILVAGLAEAVAGSLSMGAGSYLASEAEGAFYQAEIDDERPEGRSFPSANGRSLPWRSSTRVSRVRRLSGWRWGSRRTQTCSCARR